MIHTIYNPSYYPETYREIGLAPIQDLHGWWIDSPQPPPRLNRVTQRVRARHPELALRAFDFSDFGKEIELATSLFNDACADNWGFVGLSQRDFKSIATYLKPKLHPELCWFVEDAGEPVAMAICLRDFNQVLKPMQGSFWPFGWFHWLRKGACIDQVRVLFLGVRSSHQHLAVGALLQEQLWTECARLGVRGVEASWTLESNRRVNSLLTSLGAERYKTWRIYNALLRPTTQF